VTCRGHQQALSFRADGVTVAITPTASWPPQPGAAILGTLGDHSSTVATETSPQQLFS
jgi:hypothetical protein